jgi:vacuolar protein sorting-associated protein 13A/C
MQVPWAKLGREPIIVEFDRLYLLAGPPDDQTSSNASAAETVESYEASIDQLELEAKRKRVAEAEMKWLEEQEARKSKAASASTTAGKTPSPPQDESIAKTLGGRLQTMIEPILGNLQLKLSNVHIRYEEGDDERGEDPLFMDPPLTLTIPAPEASKGAKGKRRLGSPEVRQRCVLGLILGEVTAHTVDANGQRAFVVENVLQCLRKAVELSKLCAYFDVALEPLPFSFDPSSRGESSVGPEGVRSYIGAPIKPPRPGCSWSDVTPGEWDALLLPALHYEARVGNGMPVKGSATSALGGGVKPKPSASSSQELYRHDFILSPVSGGMRYTRRTPKFRASDDDAKQEATLSLREVKLRLR